MNAITANFENILKFARDYGLPIAKKRAILREYLQTKILSLIYREDISKNLFFVGGTSLRLLRGLDRFSEDLDFDAVAITAVEIHELLSRTVKKLEGENILPDFYQQKGKNKISSDIVTLCLARFQRERNRLSNFKSKLKPFLFEKENIAKLDFFPKLVGNFGLPAGEAGK